MRKLFIVVYVCLEVSAVLNPASAQNWSKTTAPNATWSAVACSADGHIAVAANNAPSLSAPGGIYNSTNSGGSWSNRFSSTWAGFAVSADGRTVFAAPNGSHGISDSINAGMNWTTEGNFSHLPWASIACSADGTNKVAVDESEIFATYGTSSLQVANAQISD
jgi:hypothetical protein